MHHIMSLFLILCFLFPLSGITQEADEAVAKQTMPIFCQEYSGQIEFVRSRITQMAEAFPQEKYNWRPAEGVRSVAEVYRHVAQAHFNLLKKNRI